MKIKHPLHLFSILVFPFLIGFFLHEIITKLELNQAISETTYLILAAAVLGLTASLMILFKRKY